MTTKGHYLTATENCIAALSSLLSNSDTEQWLNQYSQLFDDLTYQVDELPLIYNCNFEGQHFENISRFCAKYEERLSII